MAPSTITSSIETLSVSFPLVTMVIFIILTLSRMESGAKVCPILKGMLCRDNPSQCPGFTFSTIFSYDDHQADAKKIVLDSDLDVLQARSFGQN